MSEPTLDVVGIGNALVDVISSESHEFIAEQGLVPGSMNLIDEARWKELYDAMGVGTEVSGGSGANTTVGVASLGGSAHYLGRVKNDQLGTVFSHDIRAAGVGYTTPLAEDGPATGCCLVLVTPDDGQRTMNTYLGASSLFGESDVDPDVIRSAQNLYLEGYLFDPPAAQEAFRYAASVAHEAGRRVSVTLSDAFCVDRHRDAFLGLLENHIDLVFANESELCSLYETGDFESALRSIADQVPLAVVTRSEKGSVILAGAERVDIPAAPVDVVDTTGAGDMYAAGFLYGLSTGRNLETCGAIAAIAAAEVISHIGPRPLVPLDSLIKDL